MNERSLTEVCAILHTYCISLAFYVFESGEKGWNMSFPPRNATGRAELAYDFFLAAFQNQRSFHLEELAAYSNYRMGTIEKYLKHKWKWHLKRVADKTYVVLPTFARTTKNEFVAAHSQTWHGPVVTSSQMEQPTTHGISRQGWIALGFFAVVTIALFIRRRL